MPYITTKPKEFTLDDIPEMRLLGKLLNGGVLTKEERDYMREAKQEEIEERGMTRDEIASDDAGQPVRGEL